MIRHLAPLAAIALLPACAPYSTHALSPAERVTTQVVALEVLSVVSTKKTLADHVATWVTGRDCSTVRAEREGVWCVDWPAPAPPPQQVYCYASLARPSCYAQPYNEGNDRLIGFVPAGTPLRR